MRIGSFEALSRAVVFLCVTQFCAFTYGQTQQKPAADERFVESTRKTALRFLPLVQADAKDQNIVFSPLGFSFSAALLQNGADETARKEIWGTFSFVADSPADLNEQASNLKNRIVSPHSKESAVTKKPVENPQIGPPYVPAPARTELTTTIAVNSSERYRPAFVKIAREKYGAELDAWRGVKVRQANGKPTLGTVALPAGLVAGMGQLDFVLINKVRAGCRWDGWRPSDGPTSGIYFKNGPPALRLPPPLRLPSAKPEPQEEPKVVIAPKSTFTIPGGAEVKVPLIEKKDTFAYYRGDGFQAVSTDCDKFSYNVFLPDENRSLDWLERNLTPESIDELETHPQRAGMQVYMPEFRIEKEREFTKYLKALGMKYSFSKFSAFRQLLTNPAGAKLTKVGQKAYVKLDHNGIEAEAITYFGGVAGGVPMMRNLPPPPPMIVVNRPFLFTITDAETHAILFMGAVHDPRVGK